MKNNRDIPKELKQFNSFFTKFEYKHDLARVFDDFLTVVICCMAHQTEENQYFETIKIYSEDELQLFCKMFAELVMIYSKAKADGQWIDPLGTYYEILSSNYKKSALGQFFTPVALCDMIAQFTIGEEWGKTIGEPCAGSGRMILAANQKLQGNYFVAQDIDPMCCKMTAINLCFHEIRAEVHCKDALNPASKGYAMAINYEYWRNNTLSIFYHRSA